MSSIKTIFSPFTFPEVEVILTSLALIVLKETSPEVVVTLTLFKAFKGIWMSNFPLVETILTLFKLIFLPINKHPWYLPSILEFTKPLIKTFFFSFLVFKETSLLFFTKSTYSKASESISRLIVSALSFSQISKFAKYSSSKCLQLFY